MPTDAELNRAWFGRHKSLSAWQAFLSAGTMSEDKIIATCHKSLSAWQAFLSEGDELEERLLIKVTKACRLGRHFCQDIMSQQQHCKFAPVTKACRLGRHFCRQRTVQPLDNRQRRHKSLSAWQAFLSLRCADLTGADLRGSQKPVGLAGISVKSSGVGVCIIRARVTKACRLGRHFCPSPLPEAQRVPATESQKPVGLAGISVSSATAPENFSVKLTSQKPVGLAGISVGMPPSTRSLSLPLTSQKPVGLAGISVHL